MKKELLANAGQLLHGNDWVTPLSIDLAINRKTIQRYNSGENAINQNLAPEIVALLTVKKTAIDNTINAIQKDYYIDEKADLTASFVVVSEGGHLLDEQFNTIEDAKKWVNETWDEDDQYLATFHEMTIAQQYALETMQDFDDIYPAADVLKAIKSGQFEKSAQEYYTMLCELDENHLGREYYEYFIANEFNLTRNPNFSCSDEDDFDHRKTMSYKQFIMKRIAELSKYVAVNF